MLDTGNAWQASSGVGTGSLRRLAAPLLQCRYSSQRGQIAGMLTVPLQPVRGHCLDATAGAEVKAVAAHIEDISLGGQRLPVLRS